MSIFSWAWLLLIAINLSLVAEEIPESIRMGQWDLAVSGEVRYHVVDPRDPSKRIPFPESIWNDVGRRVVRPMADHTTAWKMIKEGTWQSFVRQSVTSVDDVIIGEYAVNPGYEICFELEPVSTPDQKAWCRGLVDRWLIPLPEGYVQAGLAGGHISTWNKWYWGTSARIHVVRGAAPKVGSGGPSDHVYWYDRNMTDEDMLIEIAGISEKLDICKEFGHYVGVYPKWGAPRTRAEVAWPSGQFLVRLSVPRVLYEAEVTAYLKKFPSSWLRKIDYDPQRLMLQVLDDAITEMTKHIDGPLEFLRYSFKTYPFDDACRRAWNILPDNDLDRQHKDAIKAIHENWAKTPADKIKLSDYHDAMLAYRRDLIAKITAERDRIAKDGVERKEK